MDGVVLKDGLIYGWPVDGSLVDGFYTIWSTQVRYVGVGAMVVGGIYTLWSMVRRMIIDMTAAGILAETVIPA